MSIRFAAAGSGECAAVARVLRSLALATPANDHDLALAASPSLRAALRHFARHGLSAARTAREEADTAKALGDTLACHEWLAISRQLDTPPSRQIWRRRHPKG